MWTPTSGRSSHRCMSSSPPTSMTSVSSRQTAVATRRGCSSRSAAQPNIAVGVMIVGLYSWSSLRQELLPDIEFPFVTVITPVPGAGAEDVASQVTAPVEQAIKNIPRLQQYQSTSGNSLSLVFAEFEFGTNVKETVTEVEQAVGQLDLPEGSEPQVSSFDFNSQPIVIATVAPAPGADP